MRIEEEIQQSKPFVDPFQKVAVNIAFTSGWLSERSNGVLNKYSLTIQQYNILRILRGQSPKGVTVKFLIERMLDKSSNASRLVDKLVAKEYVLRIQNKEDRRRVDVFITEKGLEVLEKASLALNKSMNDISNLTIEECHLLSDLLDRLRG